MKKTKPNDKQTLESKPNSEMEVTAAEKLRKASRCTQAEKTHRTNSTFGFCHR